MILRISRRGGRVLCLSWGEQKKERQEPQARLRILRPGPTTGGGPGRARVTGDDSERNRHGCKSALLLCPLSPPLLPAEAPRRTKTMFPFASARARGAGPWGTPTSPASWANSLRKPSSMSSSLTSICRGRRGSEKPRARQRAAGSPPPPRSAPARPGSRA